MLKTVCLQSQKRLGAKKLSTSIAGKVVKIGPSGSLITDIENEQLLNVPHDETTSIKFDAHSTVGIFPADAEQPMGTLVARTGESGCLEIEIVGMNLSEMLGINVGETVSVST